MAVTAGWSRTRMSWLVTALVVVGGLVALQVYRSSHPAPYPLKNMHATAKLSVTDGEHVQQVADRIAGKGKLTAIAMDRLEVVGQVDLTSVGTSRDDGWLDLFLIDNRTHSLVSIVSYVEVGDRMALGRDGRDLRLAKKYAWLAPVAPPPDAYGYTAEGTALSFAPTQRGPITFTAMLDEGALPITDPARDLTLALAYVTDDDAWAVRVHITS